MFTSMLLIKNLVLLLLVPKNLSNINFLPSVKYIEKVSDDKGPFSHF